MRNLWGKELKFPEDIFYSPELLWVKTESENRLRLGISDIAVKSVKQLLYVTIQARKGSQLNKGDLIGTVETSKMVWEIIAPVSGVVVTINAKVAEGNPAPLVKDPYEEGWLLEIEKTSQTDSELKELHWGEESKTKEWIDEMVMANVPLSEGS